ATMAPSSTLQLASPSWFQLSRLFVLPSNSVIHPASEDWVAQPRIADAMTSAPAASADSAFMGPPPGEFANYAPETKGSLGFDTARLHYPGPELVLGADEAGQLLGLAAHGEAPLSRQALLHLRRGEQRRHVTMDALDQGGRHGAGPE